MVRRRQLLAGLGVAATGTLAGCPEGSSNTQPPTATGRGAGTDAGAVCGAELAVAAQLNVYRTRLDDAVALGRASRAGAGARVAGTIFERFENASGEYGVHETLERTDEETYHAFEGALGDVRSELQAGDVAGAATAAAEATDAIERVQESLIGIGGRTAMDLLWLAGRGANADVLARAGAFAAAETVLTKTTATFEAMGVHAVLEKENADAYEAFEGALGDARDASSAEDAEGVTSAVATALEAAVDGASSIASETVADVGHLATYQSRGYDAAVLASMGGPGDGLAHATTLSTYRARVHDAVWLADAGEREAAAAAVESVFADFEGARAHEVLEEADHDAYEGFEGGLESLQSAITEGSGVADAAATVDGHLRTGISLLAGSGAPALQAGFFRARFADARERYRRGDADAAAAIAEALFGRFEENQLDFHETLEETDASLYERFEHEHLQALIEAYENGDDEDVATHHDGVQTALLDFEATQSATIASGAETTVAIGRAYDASALATLGDTDRAAAVVRATFETFEGGAAGFHEALEHADHDLYEAFEGDLGAIRTAANDGGDVSVAVSTFAATATDGIYAIVAGSGGAMGEPAAATVGDVVADFEAARVHEALESADRETYEAFEGALNDYASALKAGETPVGPFADATLRAQFAVAGALENAPETAGANDDGEATETSPSGGPNVAEGVPEDADHIVAMEAVTFEPAELTVAVGDTVAFEYAAGEPHTVTARSDGLAEGATYWASGGFESEEAAIAGWEEGEGAVQSGQSYVHTFETAGEHAYYCIPHEAAGMEGTILVEE